MSRKGNNERGSVSFDTRHLRAKTKTMTRTERDSKRAIEGERYIFKSGTKR